MTTIKNTISNITNIDFNLLTNALLGTDFNDLTPEASNIESRPMYEEVEYGVYDTAARCTIEDTYALPDVCLAETTELDVWLSNRGLDRDLYLKEEYIDNAIWAARDAKYRLSLWQQGLEEFNYNVKPYELRRFAAEKKRVSKLFSDAKAMINNLDNSFYSYDEDFHLIDRVKDTWGSDILREIKNSIFLGLWSEGMCATIYENLSDYKEFMTHENFLLAKGYLLRRLAQCQEEYDCISNTGYCSIKTSGWTQVLNDHIATYKAYMAELAEEEKINAVSPYANDDRLFGEMNIGSIESAIDTKRRITQLMDTYKYSSDRASETIYKNDSLEATMKSIQDDYMLSREEVIDKVKAYVKEHTGKDALFKECIGLLEEIAITKDFQESFYADTTEDDTEDLVDTYLLNQED